MHITACEYAGHKRRQSPQQGSKNVMDEPPVPSRADVIIVVLALERVDCGKLRSSTELIIDRDYNSIIMALLNFYQKGIW